MTDGVFSAEAPLTEAVRVQQALDASAEALKRIDRHEADCVEFRREIKHALDRLANRWWSAALSLIALLLSVVGYLGSRALFPGG